MAEQPANRLAEYIRSGRSVPNAGANALRRLIGGVGDYAAERYNTARYTVANALYAAANPQEAIQEFSAAVSRQPAPFQQVGEQDMETAMSFWNPAGLLGKIVWHGSPHKFDKFDASKIGTGEGAQAYGHGVYLADAQDVASGYAGMRPMAGVSTLDGKPWAAKNRAQMLAESRARGAKSYEKAEASIRREIDSAIASREFEAAQEAQDSLKALLDMRRLGVDLNTGENLYKADLPDEWIPKMLDWDKPLSQQDDAVKAALRKSPIAPDESVWQHYTGQQLLEGEMQASGPYGKAGWATPEARALASKKLYESGIPGIRYLDGGSRPNLGRITMLEQTIANLKGKGASRAAIANTQHELDAELARASYNYVVFPGLEDQVKILERNGEPLNALLK